MTTANLSELKEILIIIENATDKSIIIKNLDLLMIKARDIRYQLDIRNVVESGR